MIDLIRSGFFSRGDAELFRPLVDNLLHSDPYLVLADFRAYVDCQQRVSAAYARPRATGRACRSSTARAAASSPPTAPSASTAATSGTSQPVPIDLLSQDEVKAGFLQ